MPPSKIIIIRHGEKPVQDAVTAELKSNKKSDNKNLQCNDSDKVFNDLLMAQLSMSGQVRAQKLVSYFMCPAGVNFFGNIGIIVGCNPNKYSGSQRPITTVLPLANALGKQVNTTYHHEPAPGTTDPTDPTGQIAMVNYVKSLSGIVLICWEHNTIPDMIKTFGFPSFGSTWPSVYDQVVVLTSSTNTNNYDTCVVGSQVFDGASYSFLPVGGSSNADAAVEGKKPSSKRKRT